MRRAIADGTLIVGAVFWSIVVVRMLHQCVIVILIVIVYYYCVCVYYCDCSSACSALRDLMIRYIFYKTALVCGEVRVLVSEEGGGRRGGGIRVRILELSSMSSKFSDLNITSQCFK